MAKVTLRLMTLHCVKKQTTVGKDKILVYVNGQESGPFTIGKSGDDVNLSLGTTDFEGSIRITLTEQDSGTNDTLGSWTAYDTETVGIRRAHFNSLPGADYHLLYDVDAA